MSDQELAPSAIAVDKAVDIARHDNSVARPRRVILNLAAGTSISQVVKAVRLSRQRVHKIAEEAEGRGELERIPGIRPNIYRAGPALTPLAETPVMPHDGIFPQTGTLPVRFHALQARVPVNLTHADLSVWNSWDTQHGPMYKTVLEKGGVRLKVQVRGRDNAILVVHVPAVTVNLELGANVNDLDIRISKAVDICQRRVSEAVRLARGICREKYGIRTMGPATWYKSPETALERFPGLPKGARYRIAYVWVDSSTGHTEAETDSLPALRDLMDIANRISIRLSLMSTFDDMPMSGPVDKPRGS